MYRVFEIDPFFSILVVAISEDPSTEIAKLNLTFKGMNIEWDKDEFGAATYESTFIPKGKKGARQHIVMLFDAVELHDTVNAVTLASHEATHVVNWVMKSAGLTHDFENDELQAYLTGWITGKVFNTLDEYNKLKQMNGKGKKGKP